MRQVAAIPVHGAEVPVEDPDLTGESQLDGLLAWLSASIYSCEESERRIRSTIPDGESKVRLRFFI